MKKKRGGQPGNKNALGHGAPYGNQNAVGHGAPVGNKNAEKHGLYSRYLVPSPLDHLAADIILDRGEKLTMKRLLQVKQELVNEWLNHE